LGRAKELVRKAHPTGIYHAPRLNTVRTNPALRNQAWHRIGAESGRLSGFFINALQSHN